MRRRPKDRTEERGNRGDRQEGLPRRICAEAVDYAQTPTSVLLFLVLSHRSKSVSTRARKVPVETDDSHVGKMENHNLSRNKTFCYHYTLPFTKLLL